MKTKCLQSRETEPRGGVCTESSSAPSRLVALLGRAGASDSDRRRVSARAVLLPVVLGRLAPFLAPRIGLGDEALELPALVVAFLGLDALEDGANEEDGLRVRRGNVSPCPVGVEKERRDAPWRGS